jgi:hypothetical protein
MGNKKLELFLGEAPARTVDFATDFDFDLDQF